MTIRVRSNRSIVAEGLTATDAAEMWAKLTEMGWDVVIDGGQR